MKDMNYTRGDVVLGPVRIGSGAGSKIRPLVVVDAENDGNIHVCPVSSKISLDISSLPIDLHDFSEGGLDLFETSYVLTLYVYPLHPGEVVGLKGRLTEECIRSIEAMVSLPHQLNKNKRKR